MEKNIKNLIRRHLPLIKADLNVMGIDIFFKEDQLIVKIGDKVRVLNELPNHYNLIRLSDVDRIFTLGLELEYQRYTLSYNLTDDIKFTKTTTASSKRALLPTKDGIIEVFEGEELKENLFFCFDEDNNHFSYQDDDQYFEISHGYNKKLEGEKTTTIRVTPSKKEGNHLEADFSENNRIYETTLESEQVRTYLIKYFKRAIELIPEWLDLCQLQTNYPQELAEIYKAIGLDAKKK